ncbi:MAG TPA: glutathione S-transferase family protein [Myxococcota bacterium]|nr:glutathione S-transferase family protein [Myxococcota bacterium]
MKPWGDEATLEWADLPLNPMGRVPVLVHGDVVLTESFAICTWLADRERRLIPAPGSPERGVHDRWMFFCATELDAPLWRIRRNKLLLPEEQRVEEDIPRAMADFREAAGILQAGLGEFVVGGAFTVADIVIAHTLFWSTWNDLLEGFPRLQEYLERQLRRPGCPEVMRR